MWYNSRKCTMVMHLQWQGRQILARGTISISILGLFIRTVKERKLTWDFGWKTWWVEQKEYQWMDEFKWVNGCIYIVVVIDSEMIAKFQCSDSPCSDKCAVWWKVFERKLMKEESNDQQIGLTVDRWEHWYGEGKQKVGKENNLQLSTENEWMFFLVLFV